MFYDASLSSSLQIMRQIMAGKGCEESSVMELLKEAEEMKQNLVRSWRYSSNSLLNRDQFHCSVRCGEKDRVLISGIRCSNTHISLI